MVFLLRYNNLFFLVDKKKAFINLMKSGHPIPFFWRKTMRQSILLASAAVVALGTVQVANASISPATSGTNAAVSGEFGQPGNINAPNGENWSVEFTADADANPANFLTVDSLGIYDSDFATGLSEAHNVALYEVVSAAGVTLTPTLLASATVPSGAGSNASDGPYNDSSGSAADGQEGFRYENITPVVLTTGAKYSVVAYNIGGADGYGNPANETLVGTDLTFDGESFTGSTTTADGPSNAGYPGTGGQSLFGDASFGYTIGDAVPEPASLSIIGLASILALTRRRRAV
jgi:hypothetical protein